MGDFGFSVLTSAFIMYMMYEGTLMLQAKLWKSRLSIP